MNAVLASFRLANSHLRLLIDAGRRVIKSVGARKLALEAIATGAHADQRNRRKRHRSANNQPPPALSTHQSGASYAFA